MQVEQLPHVPQPPHWTLDWEDINKSYAWIRDLKDCPQDPIYHAEGDVWIHQKMVSQAMTDLPAWRNLSPSARAIVFWAGLLHDIAKPHTTKEEDGRITARGHSFVGMRIARPILWRMDIPFPQREQILNLIRNHQFPFYLIEREDPLKLLQKISLGAPCHWLAILAEADIRGRICEDMDDIITRIQLFHQLAEENGLLHQPQTFQNPLTLYRYFKGSWPITDQAPFDDYQSEVILMCGLPGSGKDTWLKQNHPNLPIISLDAIRNELGLRPGDQHGKVIFEARERAKGYLRKKIDFAWNATNLSHDQRTRCISLFEAYKAKTKIVYIEVDCQTHQQQNQNRPNAVPTNRIEKMIQRWQPPNPWEAPEVDYVFQNESLP